MNPCAICDEAFSCKYIRETLDIEDACFKKWTYETTKNSVNND
jgi:hypothetical protein